MSKVRIYCEAVFIAGAIAVAMLIGDLHLHYILEDPLTFTVLAGGVVLGEMLPVKIPRRGDDEELTLDGGAAQRREELGVGLGPNARAQVPVDPGPAGTPGGATGAPPSAASPHVTSSARTA